MMFLLGFIPAQSSVVFKSYISIECTLYSYQLSQLSLAYCLLKFVNILLYTITYGITFVLQLYSNPSLLAVYHIFFVSLCLHSVLACYANFYQYYFVPFFSKTNISGRLASILIPIPNLVSTQISMLLLATIF